MRTSVFTLPCLLALLLVAGCASAQAPIKPVAQVELPRYMGRWYVIGSIPTRFERDGYNPVETYCLTPEGEVDTTFQFRPGGFGAALKTIHSTATVVDGRGHAEWSVRVFGILHAQYLVAWLSPGYDQVIVARDKRDYLWLMARTPQVSDADYRALLARAQALGYDPGKVVKAPQQWPERAAAQAGTAPRDPAGGSAPAICAGSS